MKKSNAFLTGSIILGTIVIIVSLLYLFSGQGKKTKVIHWEENYKHNNRDPYGLYVLYELLTNYNKNQTLQPVQEPLYKTLKQNPEGKDNYVFVGSNLFLGRKDVDSLLKFVAAGNTAFISSKAFSAKLMDTLREPFCAGYSSNYEHKDSLITMNFSHSSLRTEKGYHYKSPRKDGATVLYNWQGTDGNYFCDSVKFWTELGFIRTGQGEEYVNFIEVPFGKGKFLFHTNPAAFANYYLLNKENLEYASKVMSHLNTGNIYWDEFSKLPYAVESQDSSQDSLRPGPLDLMLSHPSLRFAWYLLLVLIILYIIFFAKRKQRIIPVLQSHTNTSLEFIKTIGTLYFKQNNHRKLMKLKLKLFLNFVRQRYQIPTNNINEELAKKISLKSNIAEEHIQAILKEINVVNWYHVEMENEDLFRLHSLLDFFYKNCK